MRSFSCPNRWLESLYKRTIDTTSSFHESPQQNTSQQWDKSERTTLFLLLLLLLPATQNATKRSLLVDGAPTNAEKCQTINCSCSLLNSFALVSGFPSCLWPQTTLRADGIMIIFRSISTPLLFLGLRLTIDKWRRLCSVVGRCHSEGFSLFQSHHDGGVNSICYRTKNVKSS